MKKSNDLELIEHNLCALKAEIDRYSKLGSRDVTLLLNANYQDIKALFLKESNSTSSNSTCISDINELLNEANDICKSLNSVNFS